MGPRKGPFRLAGLAALVVMVVGLGMGLLFAATESSVAVGASAKLPDKHKKVDPIEANGAIFEGWPKPDVAVVFTGELDGYLEPCGCAGLENQLGGLKRRATFLKQLRGKGWPVVALDAGGQEKDSGIQAGHKLEFAYGALMKLGYDAVGFGENDLKLDPLQVAINLDGATNPLVSANVGLGDFESGLSKRYKVIERGGVRIGITTVLGQKEVAQMQHAADLKLLGPHEAILEVLPKLSEAKCDHMILLVNAMPEEAKELANRHQEFDWVLATRGTEVPPKEPATMEGRDAHLIEVGHKGMYAVVVGFYKNGAPSFRYQRVPLDHRFADDAEIYKMQVEYQNNLKSMGWDGLGLKPTAHPSGRKFAGSKVCGDCHTKAAAAFEKTPHAHATETLLKYANPPRLHDPECVSCHATGWEPQKNFPFESGFVSMEKTPELAGNGCENCHGPAAKHAAAENGELELSEPEVEQLRAALRLNILPNEGNKDGQVFDQGKVVNMCQQCHDIDNSPEFDFQKYWPKVKHEGKD
ncbi:MAG: hypothetical protein IT425_01240 [Pirellulales bacterium]|nr:hypothetical protein [Pirellulales bacterium]